MSGTDKKMSFKPVFYSFEKWALVLVLSLAREWLYPCRVCVLLLCVESQQNFVGMGNNARIRDWYFHVRKLALECCCHFCCF